MKKRLWLFSVIILILCYTIYSEGKTEANIPKVMNMKIRLIFNDITLTATLHDNPTARDFISLLPLTLKLEDYAGT